MALSLRPLRREDFALLSQWLSQPHVEPWWREDYDPESIERRYGPSVDGTDRTQMLIVERDGSPVAFVQLYLLDDNPDWKRALASAGAYDDAAGIDYLIGDEGAIGKGLGPQIIDSLTEMAWQCYPGVLEVVAAVQQDNRRSWRALEKAGFDRAWTGDIRSEDPSDNGPSYVYVRRRTAAAPAQAVPAQPVPAQPAGNRPAGPQLAAAKPSEAQPAGPQPAKASNR
ncbi:MAG TPA: GNAT family N-acetyltransferase [Acidimicrobiales bacterium]|nr:GNAT family N-acetyltransferase [Acidimicrobiales bacterium]